MSLRKTIFWLHLATGCVVGIIVLLMSVTGALLTYERQITAWADRGFRSTPPSAASARLPVESMIEKVAARNDGLPTAITLRADASAPAEVSFGREHVFLVDVYSGAVLGEGSQAARSFFQKVENWHRWLGASNEHRALGRAVTGVCNFGFLLLVVSGPFLWLPRRWSWQNVKTVALFRGGLSGRARDFNWHNVIGIWCAVPLFAIVSERRGDVVSVGEQSAVPDHGKRASCAGQWAAWRRVDSAGSAAARAEPRGPESICGPAPSSRFLDGAV